MGSNAMTRYRVSSYIPTDDVGNVSAIVKVVEAEYPISAVRSISGFESARITGANHVDGVTTWALPDSKRRIVCKVLLPGDE